MAGSPVFPATAIGNELLDPRDPCVEWREYYSLELSKPYYHNVLMHTTTFEVPTGFLTRFPLFHRRHGLGVTEEGRVFRRAAASSSGESGNSSAGGAEGAGGASAAPPCEGGSPGSSSSSTAPSGGSLTLKQKLAAYGGGGLILYLIVHNVLLAMIFFSLYFLHMDLVGFARSYGFNIMSEKPALAADEDGVAPVKKYPSFWATLGISIVLNKMLVPLELAVTLMMAPVFVPRLQPFASQFIPRVKAMARNFKMG
ncbi:hypothetical protein DQ04_13951020 [Trypanosoma grayi]|uniref:hypothetical protein n=1 Tax=Trypanosoma grayi TaxID=71804 RepID=UPI0004F40EE5|nr:hypothetical protein DQ04_13951020 [Trypanosoma grayi]KEG06435.1 hypothetical protein DQ04_13951020 [Trypanosoma grayi]